MGLLGRLFGLRGGGARQRKHDRRMPRTVAELHRAYDAYSSKKGLTWRRSIEDASFSNPAGHVFRYKAKVLSDTIRPGRTCTFFVTEAVGPGVGVDPANGRTTDLPWDLRNKPYEVSKLCQGGRAVTGMISVDDRAKAARLAADKAYHDIHGRYPALRGARRR